MKDDTNKCAAALAALVTWYGEEDNACYARRVQKARRLLQRLHPRALNEEKQRLASNHDAEQEPR